MPAPVKDSEFGRLPHGRSVRVLTLGREPGVVVRVLDLGATIHRLEVTGGDGRRRNVVHNLGSAEAYLASTTYLGSTVGRYANRIAHGRFPLDGSEIQLGVNDGEHHLHGGPDGFDRRSWTVVDASDEHAELSLVSPDGDQGYPGTLHVTTRFEVEPDRVRIAFTATTDRTTPVNLTNHAYFNLDGDDAGTVDEHVLQLAADHYLPVDAGAIPCAPPAAVQGTPFDFRQPRPLGPAIRAPHPQVRAARGIDHNLVLTGEPDRPAAALESPRSRTRLELYTDQPGLQVYSGNFLDGGELSGRDRLLRQGDGLALEPQVFPDSPNHPEFPSPWLAPGETYAARLEWRFVALG